MHFSLKLATPQDTPILYALLVLCGEHMHRTQGMSHWYPFRPYQQFLEQIDPLRLYGLYADDLLAGTFTLNDQPRRYYYADLWAQPDARALYFGLFGVIPVFQVKGLGKWAMQQADAFTQTAGYQAIRFDAVAHNAPLLNFYDRLGYSRRATLTFPPPNNTEAVCYERVFQ